MNNLNFQSRKLEIISYLININDEVIFSEIEKSIKQTSVEIGFKPFTQKQMVDRAKRANNDYRNGKFMTHEKLVEESENW